ncbi:MAG: VOC family protein [Opitutaceae bacterium]|nr:VOC family protein [Opitutaceae bacterium]
MPSKSKFNRKSAARKPARKSAAKSVAKPTKSKPKKPAKKQRAKAAVAGLTAVTPHLICAGAADAIEFYKKAFNAFEEGRLPDHDGKVMHAVLRIGGAPVMLVDEMPEWGALGPKTLKGSPVTIHLYVDDVDAVVAQAVEAGAKVTMPVADMFWGDRYGKLEDPFGHRWSVATHLRDMTPAEVAAAAQKAFAEMPPPPSPAS